LAGNDLDDPFRNREGVIDSLAYLPEEGPGLLPGAGDSATRDSDRPPDFALALISISTDAT
jgi:hypothetical protein